MSALSFTTKKGSEIASVFDELARLRIAVFRDFPYLYEGSVAYEKAYLKTYSQSERSFLFAVYSGDEMVGATTAIPLRDETDDIRRPFTQTSADIDRIFYFGESILLPAFRGLGLGHRFFDEREAHARSFGTFRTTCFCAVERDENHPAKPLDYRPNDLFWQKRGYAKQDALRSTLDWPDIGESVSTPKTMVYWMRDL
ncbi:GNAT family N-acetyltransferase [Spirosoma sp. RP8]|uniref:GNAT family N-acetyltransferase n=1 Tax=Spirosoma liriopis TaxID=2937440 RepID=A0ABT0HDK5_9BACT|nr:GNAT family N-acetyltransferase [Spirosoma liriopis]MCK8490242.1 GNAT family N-acetyltransferase [Spirosoma liriopis]